MRASLELIAMEGREASGPRLVMNGGAFPVPTAFAASVSTSSRLTFITLDQPGDQPGTTRFLIPQPNGYPNSRALPNASSTPIVTPNSAGKDCTDVFRGGEWALTISGNVSALVQTA
ncbi:hypothetical protein [Deinococcus pimensis]|uniref:hypothetical protein n=1 Tax=Deinococcus pimensis TaxID=309888 RepID=UPI0004893752|nr:hypothetical protein [Deinococcus pimensis]